MRNGIKKMRILPIILSLILIIFACRAYVNTPTAESDSETETVTETVTETATDTVTETATETESGKTSETESEITSETEDISQTPESSTANAPTSQPSTTKLPPVSAPVSTTAAHRHIYTKKVTSPTCTNKGYTTYTCSCGRSYTDDFTKAKGHSFGKWQTVKAPTTTSEGTEKRTCSVCGVSETKAIPKLTAEITNFNEEVLSLVNKERTKRGLSPLTYCYEAQKAADLRAKEILKSFSHTRPDGRDCFSVFDDLKINRFMCGENIAYGYPTPEDVMEAWMHSPSHRDNILNEKAKGMAIAMIDNYWEQIFVI
ncbi:MAG: hypothetical protein J1F23_08540 [Oscillospiraceae bacterium]|nr:hypothetical protein [Oscillospiraceae bacterium]